MFIAHFGDAIFSLEENSESGHNSGTYSFSGIFFGLTHNTFVETSVKSLEEK